MKYTITYAATGGLTVEAPSEDEAMDELRHNSIEITSVFVEED